jgi:hypothetical protein
MPIQVLFAADLDQLPNRNLIGKVKRVSLELEVVRMVDGLSGTELFCLLNERLCSGTRGREFLNSRFWSGMSENEIKFMSQYFVDQLRNEKIWSRRASGVGTLTRSFTIDFEELTRGSKYDLEGILYSGSSGNRKTLLMAIADDLEACTGQLVIELEVNRCATGGQS